MKVDYIKINTNFLCIVLLIVLACAGLYIKLSYADDFNKCAISLNHFKSSIQKMIDGNLSPYEIRNKLTDDISGLKCDIVTIEETLIQWKEFYQTQSLNGPENIIFTLERNEIEVGLVYEKFQNKFESYFVKFPRPSPT